jgi:hypothetical protein
MGRTGTVVGIMSGSGNRIVKLDELGGTGGPMGGVREIEVVKIDDCKRRVGDVEDDAVFGDNRRTAKKGGRK